MLQLIMQIPALSITALVRDKTKAAKLEQLGVKTVIGSLDDSALMEAEGSKVDVIVQGVRLRFFVLFSALTSNRRLMGMSTESMRCSRVRRCVSSRREIKQSLSRR